jgi:hypothetical protein
MALSFERTYRELIMSIETAIVATTRASRSWSVFVQAIGGFMRHVSGPLQKAEYLLSPVMFSKNPRFAWIFWAITGDFFSRKKERRHSSYAALQLRRTGLSTSRSLGECWLARLFDTVAVHAARLRQGFAGLCGSSAEASAQADAGEDARCDENYKLQAESRRIIRRNSRQNSRRRSGGGIACYAFAKAQFGWNF